MKNPRHGTQKGGLKRPLSTSNLKAHPAMYRAYTALETALHSGSDSDLVRALNIYIDLADKQGFLVSTAMLLRDSLSRAIIAQERGTLPVQQTSETTEEEQTDPATSQRAYPPSQSPHEHDDQETFGTLIV
jgi:hypothetical protein